ncbi:MAG: acetate kinase [Candidatus Bathyarchaeia archaeon]
MNILTLNCGSSSVKYTLWEMPGRRRLCNGIVERVGFGDSTIKHYGKRAVSTKCDSPNHDAAIKLMLKFITDVEYGVVKSVSEIDAVGHRVVHGGENFNQSVLIDKEVIEAIEEYSELAPLHNPPNLSGIRASMNQMPDKPNIAVFDTAFFSTIPRHIHTYALPYEWYERYNIRRYGFHGTSHLYVSRRAAALLHRKPSELKMVSLHIGNGVSITAVKEGVAFDHSMGFTPLEGAVMGTRCGDIDPAIPLYMMSRCGFDVEEMSRILNERSGLLGVTGRYVDRRDIIEAAKKGDERCKLAMEMECYRLRKYIGAYAAAMGGVDTIIFTAGVGENQPIYRVKTCEGLEFLGVKIDKEKNEMAVDRNGEAIISVDDPQYPVKVLVIPTDEELVIAEDVYAILNGTYDIYTRFEYIFQKEDFKPTLNIQPA